MSPTITPDVAAHVLNHFGRDGIPAGDWHETLITLIARADIEDAAKLAGAFPDYGSAVLIAKYDRNGLDCLQDIAQGRCTRCKQEDGPFAQGGLCEPCAAPMPLDGVA